MDNRLERFIQRQHTHGNVPVVLTSFFTKTTHHATLQSCIEHLTVLQYHRCFSPTICAGPAFSFLYHHTFTFYTLALSTLHHRLPGRQQNIPKELSSVSESITLVLSETEPSVFILLYLDLTTTKRVDQHRAGQSHQPSCLPVQLSRTRTRTWRPRSLSTRSLPVPRSGQKMKFRAQLSYYTWRSTFYVTYH